MLTGVWKKNVPGRGDTRTKALRPDCSWPSRNSKGASVCLRVSEKGQGEDPGFGVCLEGVLCSESGVREGIPGRRNRQAEASWGL